MALRRSEQHGMRGVRARVPFGTAFTTRLPQTRVVVTSSRTTVDVVGPHPFAPLAPLGAATSVLGHARLQSPAVRLLRQALDVIVDLGALVLIVWLIPFVILGISSPIVLILWAVLALVHKL